VYCACLYYSAVPLINIHFSLLDAYANESQVCMALNVCSRLLQVRCKHLSDILLLLLLLQSLLSVLYTVALHEKSLFFEQEHSSLHDNLLWVLMCVCV
jgi:hypothetical protein